MRLYEYEAKAVLSKNGVPTSKGGVAKTADDAARIAGEVGGDVVLKSQVLSGGRMKAGGVQFASSPDEARGHADRILRLEIGGHMPRGVLVESKSAVKQEYYGGIIYDAVAKLPVAIFSDMGGIDIEQVAEEHPDHVARARGRCATRSADAPCLTDGGEQPRVAILERAGVHVDPVTQRGHGIGLRRGREAAADRQGPHPRCARREQGRRRVVAHDGLRPVQLEERGPRGEGTRQRPGHRPAAD